MTFADEGQRIRRLTRLLFSIIWVVPATLAALQMTVVGDASGTHYGIGTAIVWQGSAWMLWGLWAQLILTLVDRVKLDTARVLPWLLLHVGMTVLLSAANVLAIAWLDHVFGAVGQVTSYAFALRVVLVNHLDIQVVLYWAVLGVAYMVEFVRRYRERDRAATELEQKVARTQLEALRMQLNPHFLFNALNSVAELMEMDVKEAQRMLIRVSDLLRLSLRSAGHSLIPVWQEVELVELYLQISLRGIRTNPSPCASCAWGTDSRLWWKTTARGSMGCSPPAADSSPRCPRSMGSASGSPTPARDSRCSTAIAMRSA
jgi:hypothetical protein